MENVIKLTNYDRIKEFRNIYIYIDSEMKYFVLKNMNNALNGQENVTF